MEENLFTSQQNPNLSGIQCLKEIVKRLENKEPNDICIEAVIESFFNNPDYEVGKFGFCLDCCEIVYSEDDCFQCSKCLSENIIIFNTVKDEEGLDFVIDILERWQAIFAPIKMVSGLSDKAKIYNGIFNMYENMPDASYTVDDIDSQYAYVIEMIFRNLVEHINEFYDDVFGDEENIDGDRLLAEALENLTLETLQQDEELILSHKFPLSEDELMAFCLECNRTSILPMKNAQCPHCSSKILLFTRSVRTQEDFKLYFGSLREDMASYEPIKELNSIREKADIYDIFCGEDDLRKIRAEIPKLKEPVKSVAIKILNNMELFQTAERLHK